MARQGYWRKRSEVRGSGTCWVTKGARRIERKRSRMSEPHRKRPNKEKPMEKGNKKRLNKERRAQKPHKNTWARSGKTQKGRKKYCEREATEGKKRQRDRGCGNIEKAVMAEAHCCFIFFV